MPLTHDVVVVGGGPGGSAAATLLAREGFDVALFEQGEYPRHKVCGEFLSPESRHVLERMDAGEAVRNAGAREVESMRITSSHGAEARHRLPAAGLSIRRLVFDELLFQHARSEGVDARIGAEVQSIRGSLDNGFDVETTTGHARCKVVLGAFGKQSRLNRVLDVPSTRRRTPFLGFKTYASGSSVFGVELHAARNGYCGLIQVEDGSLNVCWLVHRSVLDSAKTPTATLDYLKNHNSSLHVRLEASKLFDDQPLATSNLTFAPRTAVVKDVLLVGDAAGMISPLCGDGMAMALHSAELAAATSAKLLRGEISASDVRRHYPEQWRRSFGRRMRIGWMLQKLFMGPGVVSQTGVNVMRHFPPVTSWILRTTRG